MQGFVLRLQWTIPLSSVCASSWLTLIPLSHLIWRWERSPLSSFTSSSHCRKWTHPGSNPHHKLPNGHHHSAWCTRSLSLCLSPHAFFPSFGFLSLELFFFTKLFILSHSTSRWLFSFFLQILEHRVHTSFISPFTFLFLAKNVPMIRNSTHCNTVLKSCSTQTSNFHHPKELRESQDSGSYYKMFAKTEKLKKKKSFISQLTVQAQSLKHYEQHILYLLDR